MNMTPELAWAIGLFEAEGCFTKHVKKSGRMQPAMKLGMTDRDVVEKFASVVGRGQIGYREGTGTRKPMWIWHVEGYDAVSSLYATLVPLLGGRRAERGKEILVEYLATRKFSRRDPHPCGYEGCQQITTRSICIDCYARKWRIEHPGYATDRVREHRARRKEGE